MSPSLSTEPQKMKYYSACLLLYPHHQVLWLFNRCHVILCDPMDCSTPGFPVLHHFLESAQTHVHWVNDAIQPSLLSPLLLLPSIFLSTRVFSNESAFCLRWPNHWNFSFSISPSKEYSGWFPLGLTSLISLLSKELSRVISKTTVWKHQFFGTQPSLRPNSHIHTCLLEKP